MPYLVRPFDVRRLADARNAIIAATTGDVGPLQTLYVAAHDALSDLDPDEIREHVMAHREAGELDKAALAAANEVHEAWEGIVAVGATIADAARFRAFAWSAAGARYHGSSPDRETFKRYARGASLPGESAEDSALFAALPALIGLGPELPDELNGPPPVKGEPVWSTLQLLEGDWAGVDPIDGMWLAPEACQAHYAAASPPWRDALARGAQQGLLVREAD